MAWISGRTWIAASLVFLFPLAAGVFFVVIVREQLNPRSGMLDRCADVPHRLQRPLSSLGPCVARCSGAWNASPSSTTPMSTEGIRMFLALNTDRHVLKKGMPAARAVWNPAAESLWVGRTHKVAPLRRRSSSVGPGSALRPYRLPLSAPLAGLAGRLADGTVATRKPRLP